MKSFKNNNEFFLNTLHPDVHEHPENVNAFNIYTQDRFNTYLKKLGADEIGTITEEELTVIKNIKEQIVKLKKDNQDVDKDRLEFDLAIIFHSNLKELNWGRWLLDDYSMWRWLSMKFFLKEVFWRRGENLFKRYENDKGQIQDSAKATYDHLVGKRTRDIFPRRYFIIGERLFDKNSKYDLLEKLAEKSKATRSGGFGNLIANIVETKLISPNDYVSKTVSKILFTDKRVGDDKEVKNAFIRYNAYRNRLLNNASENIFRNEICIIGD